MTYFVVNTKFIHSLNAINICLLCDKLLRRDTSINVINLQKLIKYNINRNKNIDPSFRSVVGSAHKSTQETSAIAAPA